MSRERQPLCWVGLLLASLGTTVWASDPRLTMVEPGFVARTREPVSAGLPFGRRDNGPSTSGSCSLSGFSGHCTPIAWWGTPDGSRGPVKWVRLDTQVSVGRGQRASGSDNPSERVRASCDETRCTVTTGVLKFTLNRNAFALFEQVWLDPNDRYPDSTLLVDSRTRLDDGVVLHSRPFSQLGIADNVPHYSSTADSVKSMGIEDANPLRVCIRIEGTHKPRGEGGDPSGLYDYVMRIYAFANSPYVKITYSLKAARNGIAEGPYQSDPRPKSWPVRSLVFRTTLNLGSNSTASFGTNPLDPSGSFQRSMTAGMKLTLYQSDYRRYEIRQDAGVLQRESDSWAGNWADLSGPRPTGGGMWGVTIAAEHAAQQYPRSFSMQDGALINALWAPEYSDQPYWLELFTRKTWYLVYYFHTGSASEANAGIAQAAAMMDKPLVGVPDLDALIATKAWEGPYIAPLRLGESLLDAPGYRPSWNVNRCVLSDDGREYHGVCRRNTGWLNWGRNVSDDADGYSSGGEHWNAASPFLAFVRSQDYDWSAHYVRFEATLASSHWISDQINAWPEPDTGPQEEYRGYWMDHPADDANRVMFRSPGGSTLYGEAYRNFILTGTLSRVGRVVVFPGYSARGATLFSLHQVLSHHRFPQISEAYYLTGDPLFKETLHMWGEYAKGFMDDAPYPADRHWGHGMFLEAQAYEVNPDPSYPRYLKAQLDWVMNRSGRLNMQEGWLKDTADGFPGSDQRTQFGRPGYEAIPFMEGITMSRLYRVVEDFQIERARDLMYGLGLWVSRELGPPCYRTESRPPYTGTGYSSEWGRYLPRDACGSPYELEQIPEGQVYNHNAFPGTEWLTPFVYDLTGRQEFYDHGKFVWDRHWSGIPTNLFGGGGLITAGSPADHPFLQPFLYIQRVRRNENTDGAPQADVTPPTTISDLRLTPVGPDRIRLTWTAPRDDGSGMDRYDVRFSTLTLVEYADWRRLPPAQVRTLRPFWAAEPLPPSVSIPRPGGSRQEITVPLRALPPAPRFTFAIKTWDAANNLSDISNVVEWVGDPSALCTGEDGDLNCDHNTNVLDLQICANVAAGTDLDPNHLRRAERWRQETGRPTLAEACQDLARNILRQP
ncbi:MAG: hypothetical protein HYZ73_01475 [Elusimicrobia bacterium]|nr:hypothetical protein [Elusimicrobiota bacterium]